MCERFQNFMKTSVCFDPTLSSTPLYDTLILYQIIWWPIQPIFYPVQCPKSFRAMQMGLVGTQAQIAANVGVKWFLTHFLDPQFHTHVHVYTNFSSICNKNALYTTVLNDDCKFSSQWSIRYTNVCTKKRDCKVNTFYLHSTVKTHKSVTSSYLSPHLLPLILLPWPQPFVDSFSSHDLACHHQMAMSAQSQCASVSPTVQ